MHFRSRLAREYYYARFHALHAFGKLQTLQEKVEKTPWLRQVHKFRCELEAAEIRARYCADLEAYWEQKCLDELEQEEKANFNPAQPRVPAGNSDGGQWTDTGGSANPARSDFENYLRGRSRMQIIQDISHEREGEVVNAQFVGGSRKYTPVLEDEEINGGHTLEEHVYRSEAEALIIVKNHRYGLGFIVYEWRGEGLFSSVEAANDFVNRTLEENRNEVDLVASGQESEAFFIKRFGYETGKEAFRPNPNTEPYMRRTYEVAVKIVHDPNRERGYTVRTAYPMNQNR